MSKNNKNQPAFAQTVPIVQQPQYIQQPQQFVQQPQFIQQPQQFVQQPQFIQQPQPVYYNPPPQASASQLPQVTTLSPENQQKIQESQIQIRALTPFNLWNFSQSKRQEQRNIVANIDLL